MSSSNCLQSWPLRSQDGSSEGEFLIVFGAPTGHCCRVSATLSRTGSYMNVCRLSTKYLSRLWLSRAPPLDLGTLSTLSLMLLRSQDGLSEGELMTVFGALAGLDLLPCHEYGNEWGLVDERRLVPLRDGCAFT